MEGCPCRIQSFEIGSLICPYHLYRLVHKRHADDGDDQSCGSDCVGIAVVEDRLGHFGMFRLVAEKILALVHLAADRAAAQRKENKSEYGEIYGGDCEENLESFIQRSLLTCFPC